MLLTPNQVFEYVQQTGGSLHVGEDRSLHCSNIPPWLTPELRRHQHVLTRMLLGELTPPGRPENPSKNACTLCGHEIDEHYPAYTWSCQHCDCQQWKKKPGVAGIETRNMGDEHEPFPAEFKICRCGHDDVYHKKRESEVGTPCTARASEHSVLCGCPAYQKPKAPKKVKARNLFGEDHHEHSEQRF